VPGGFRVAFRWSTVAGSVCPAVSMSKNSFMVFFQGCVVAQRQPAPGGLDLKMARPRSRQSLHPGIDQAVAHLLALLAGQAAVQAGQVLAQVLRL